MVREGKGDKDRVVPLPKTLVDRLRAQIDFVARLTSSQRRRDRSRPGLASDCFEAEVSSRRPKARMAVSFPSVRLSRDPRDAATPADAPLRRHHIHENMVQKQVRKAVGGGSRNRRAVIPFATVLRRTSSRRGPTFAPCKRVGMPTWRPPNALYPCARARGRRVVLSPLDRL